MATTNWRPSLLFSLCFLVIICATLVTGDYSDLLSRLNGLPDKNKQPLLLILDHHHSDTGYDSLEHRENHALSSFLHGLNHDSVLSNRHLLHTKSNTLKYHELYQDNLNKDFKDETRYRHDDRKLDKVRDRKKKYQLDLDRNQQNINNQKDRLYSQQDRIRVERPRKKPRNKKQQNRDQEYRQDQDADQLDKFRNLINRYIHQEHHQHYNTKNYKYDKSQSRLNREKHDNEAERDTNKYSTEHETQYLLNKYGETDIGHQSNKKYRYRYDMQRDQDRYDDDGKDRYGQQDSQTYNDKKEKTQSKRAPSPVIKSLLRMSNSLRCGARNQCQNECDSNSAEEKNDCEDECEEKYECQDSEENNSCDDDCEDEETGSTQGPRIEK